jgi:hypothetical protein
MQSAPYSSWVHVFGFCFAIGSLSGFEKDALTPTLAVALPGYLVVALLAAFFAAILRIFGGIVGRNRRWRGG